MDSGDGNTIPFSSYIASAGDTFFISSPTTPTTPPPPPPTFAVPRISKKRSRPSRRPPTTVLATDASNFRAMVQIFTGIPSPPMSSSFPLNFSSPLQSTESFAPTPSISPIYQNLINTQQISSSLFQSMPPFASPEAYLRPEKFGVSKGGGFVSVAGLGEVEEDFCGERGLEWNGLAGSFGILKTGMSDHAGMNDLTMKF